MPSPSDDQSSTHSSGQGPSDDVGLLAQRAAEKHLLRVQEAQFAEEDGDANVAWPETAGPYCGCNTCIIREVLWVTWPIIEHHARTFRNAY